MAIGRVNTGGSGSGGTLTVTGIAGHTVTATKDGKTYTRTFNSSGVAVFKGLSTGTWTLTMTGDGQTATRTVDVNADYAVTITYFSATINITYPANSTCVVQTSGGTTVASDSNATSSAKTWTATVNATGTYTVTATATDGSGKSKSQSVSITTNGQNVQLVLSYDFLIFMGGIGSIVPLFSDSQSNSSCSVSKDSILQDFNENQLDYTLSVVRTSKTVDLTNYSELVIEATCFQQHEVSKWAGRLGISKNAFDVDSDENVFAGFSMYTADGVRKLYSLDISSFNGVYYVGSWGGTKTTIYNIYLSR